ncbi:Slam-dependent surface lipoprotein [Marinomonas posidonica]|uniref:Slam-dependent surface lipoprotein n=1 Tax=Marinomonas posidonica TaxID=936476 RepID=UPI003736ACBA
MKKLQLVSAMSLALGTFAFSGMASAAVVGESSNTNYVKVGTATVNGGPHTSGGAGIGVNATGIDNLVNFQGLTVYGAEDAQGVYNLNFPYTGSPTSHDNLGVFNFAQVGTSDVWVGEWSAYGTSGDSTRTVYYSGANADTSVPTSGTATYTVVGINNYDGTAASLLNGTLTADFGAATLTGAMTNSSFSKIVSIGTANINSDASVTGSNAAGIFNGTNVSEGTVSAQFYNGQADLAGLVDFAGTEYDTAFGGTQD